MGILQRIKTVFSPKPEPEFIAQQLRKPSGSFAGIIAGEMDKTNEPLCSLTLDTMQIEDHDALLEIGFGSGRFFEKLLSRGNNLQVFGLDYSEDMIELAKDYNHSLITSGKLKLHQGSSDNLPFADRSFNKVFCNNVIYFWDQPEAHLAEIYRVLKPNGIFYTGFRPKDSMLRFSFVKYDFRLYGTDEWSSVLQKNGFTDIRVINRPEKPTEIDGEYIQLESVCMAAEKKSV
ncbi:MAG: class I SAM-dependent methyltransferase [Balneolaceae bacterium]